MDNFFLGWGMRDKNVKISVLFQVGSVNDTFPMLVLCLAFMSSAEKLR